MRNYDGYDDTRLQENVFTVSFAGNPFTSQQRALDFALLRCAEVTLAGGFRYFTTADIRQDMRTESYQTYNPASGGGRFRNYDSATVVTSRPQSSLVIACHREKPAAAAGVVYDAAYLAESIREKYGLKAP